MWRPNRRSTRPGRKRSKEAEQKIENHIKGMIGIGIRVRLVAPGTITRSEGKAKRVIDERPKQFR